MFLDPLRVALQGLGFPLSPIAMAVHGLIAVLAEEARRLEYHGGGGRQRGPVGRTGHREEAPPQRRPLGVAEVQAQWELLELRRENQRRDALAREQRKARKARAPAAARVAPPAPPAPALVQGQAEDSAAAAAARAAAQAAEQAAQLADSAARESLLLLLALA